MLRKLFYNKKWISLLICIIIFIILTNYIETNQLYGTNNEINYFYYQIFQSYSSQSCFVIEPEYIDLNLITKNVTTYTTFHKECNFSYAIVQINSNGIKNYEISGPKNFTIETSFNQTKSQIILIINASDMKENYPYEIAITTNFENIDNNYFEFTSIGGSIHRLSFTYDNSIIWGDICDNCITIIRGEVNNNEGIWRGNHEKINFEENTQSISLQYSPKSKIWFYVEKIFEAIILGLCSVFLYDIIRESKKNKIENKKFLQQIKEYINDPKNILKIWVLGFIIIIIMLGLEIYKFISRQEQYLGIIVILFIFWTGLIINEIKNIINIENSLKNILIDIYVLNKVDGHLEYFIKALNNNQFPEHKLRDIKIENYLETLPNKFSGKKTLDLKEKIILANDRILLLNERIEIRDINKKEETLNILYETQSIIKDIENLVKELLE